MNCYYIDDSFFQKFHLQAKLRKRLIAFFDNKDISVICISGSNIDKEIFTEFISYCSKHDIQFVMSPSTFDVEGIRGILHHTSLLLEGYDVMYPYSGTIVCYETELARYTRYYLDVSLHIEYDLDDTIIEELEDILSEFVDKNKDNYSNRH